MPNMQLLVCCTEMLKHFILSAFRFMKGPPICAQMLVELFFFIFYMECENNFCCRDGLHSPFRTQTQAVDVLWLEWCFNFAPHSGNWGWQAHRIHMAFPAADHSSVSDVYRCSCGWIFSWIGSTWNKGATRTNFSNRAQSFCILSGVIQTFLLNGPSTSPSDCPIDFQDSWAWGLTINQYYGLLFWHCEYLVRAHLVPWGDRRVHDS